MKECLKKGSILWSAQYGLYFVRQSRCLFNGPLRQDAGMDHEERCFTMMKRLAPQPIDEIGAIGGGKYVLDRIFGPKRCDAFSCCQQEQIMVSQDETNGCAQILDEPESTQRVGASVDKVSNQPKSVGAGSESNPVQKLSEGSRAALDVADCVGGHQWEVIRLRGLNDGGGLRVFRFNDATEPATGGEGAGHFGPDRPAGLDDVVQDTVDRVLIKDAEISVFVEIHLQRLQL